MNGELDPRRNAHLGDPRWLDNWTTGSGLRMEIMDRLGKVWLCQQPVTQEQAGNLMLPDGASLVGVAGAVADTAYFGRSPGATVDGPLDAMEVDGLRFSFVGRVLASERVDGVTVLSIDKHHTMLYAAGRVIDVLDFGNGTVATPAWIGSAPTGDVDLPNDWTVRAVELDADLVAVIPNPATVVMVDGSGFHGPLPISRLQGVN